MIPKQEGLNAYSTLMSSADAHTTEDAVELKPNLAGSANILRSRHTRPKSAGKLTIGYAASR